LPARRDYADAWRDTWVTLAQVPVASLIAADYFYQQLVERSSAYLSRVSGRLAFARPASDIEGRSFDDVSADVLSEDLIEATRGLVRDLVALPGQTAQYFDRHIQAMLNVVLMQIQPDAQADVRTYIANELDKLNRDLHRLREVAGAETARRDLGQPGERAAVGDQADEEAFRALLLDLRSIVEQAPEGWPRESKAIPRERMLQIIQAVVDAALARFPPATQPSASEPLSAERATRLLLAMQSAQSHFDEAAADLKDEIEGVDRPRKRREIRRTRRTRR
jgi:hypothetical protein